MQIDSISFSDIAIFHHEEEYSIFHKLNFTRSGAGKEYLRHYFSQPFDSIEKIEGTQHILRTLLEVLHQWPQGTSNGTLLVMDKFLEYPLDAISEGAHSLNNITYKILHSADYAMVKYSVAHFADFLRDMKQVISLLEGLNTHKSLWMYVERAAQILREPALEALSEWPVEKKFSIKKNLYFAYHIRGNSKYNLQELIQIYGRLDAWYSMATAIKKYNLCFPQFVKKEAAHIKAEGLYHVLLQKPVTYGIEMDDHQNFLFLTGANMAGKSTLIKAVGAAVFLAHIGMGVPATSFKLSLFDGLLSNIDVSDNVVKGESYFFNEVQRIKNTIEKVNSGKKWLVLIDELFKGTNVQDAMKCSLAVIKGLIKIKSSLFILSTHLYEIGPELQEYPNIHFRYFETIINDDQLSFSYQLLPGISNDRIGYVILKREKVVEMLDNL